MWQHPSCSDKRCTMLHKWGCQPAVSCSLCNHCTTCKSSESLAVLAEGGDNTCALHINHSGRDSWLDERLQSRSAQHGCRISGAVKPGFDLVLQSPSLHFETITHTYDKDLGLRGSRDARHLGCTWAR